jgi:hypothetical protein
VLKAFIFLGRLDILGSRNLQVKSTENCRGLQLPGL